MVAVEGWILDAQPGRKGAVISIVDTSGRYRRVEAPISFRGYILPHRDIDPYRLADDLSYYPGVTDSRVEDWFLPPHYRRKTGIVVFEAESVSVVEKVARIAYRKGIGVSANEYPEPLVEALWNNGFHPTYLVRISGCKAELLEDPLDPEYMNPSFIVGEVFYEDGRYLLKVDGRETIIVKDSFELIGVLEDSGVHVVLASSGIRMELEALYKSSGRKGILWLETDTSLVGFNGLVEWSRISRLPLRIVSKASIGKVLTTAEAWVAKRRKYLVIRGHGRLEPPRSIMGLAAYDRGGAVYSPRPDLYWNVCQVDFNSLYPSIISKYNISGETVDDPYCKNGITPPGSSHKVCLDRPGLVSSVMEMLIPRKEEYKRLEKSTGETVYKDRKDAVKWVLVASFGYLGYRNSLFGSIMAHETVTSVARSVIEKSRRALEERGWRVIHVIVDSLFIKDPSGGKVNCREAARIVSEATGFNARSEAEYTWLVIPETKKGNGAANRYYGRLANGELKVKGLAYVRRDTPSVIRKAQWEMLSELAKAYDHYSLREASQRVLNVYKKYVEKIKGGKLGIEEFVIRRRIRKKPSRYIVYSGRRISIEYSPGRYSITYYLNLLESALRELYLESLK